MTHDLAANPAEPDGIEENGPRFVRLRHLLFSAVSFGLLSLAFAPTALAPLVFVALVPWLVHARLAPARGFTRAWLFGSLLFASSMMWWVTALAGAPGPGLAGWGVIVLVLLLMLLPFAPLVRTVVVRRDVPLVVGVPLVLAGQDAFRDTVMAGVAWHSPGYALADWTRLIQIADLCGVAPLSLAIYAVNAVAADGVLRLFFGVGPSLRAVALRAVLVGATFAAMIAYGDHRIATLSERVVEGPGLVGVQGNVAQAQKLRATPEARELIHTRHVRWMARGTARLPDVALYVWPETSFFPADDRVPPAGEEKRGNTLRESLNWTRKTSGTNVAGEFAAATAARRGVAPPVYLLGLSLRDDGPDGARRTRNSAALIETRGSKLEPVDLYHKRELVPFGEYVPGSPSIRAALTEFVESTAGYAPSMTPGEASVSWPIESAAGRHRFAVTICFEIVFPHYFTEARAAGVDFVVNVSNDAWYAGSAELALVHAQTKFRAVENRMSIFRVSNTGISTLIDPLGREVAVVMHDGRREDVEGVLAARVPVGADAPPAVKAEKWARPVLITLGLLMLPLSAFFKRRKLGGLGPSLFT